MHSGGAGQRNPRRRFCGCQERRHFPAIGKTSAAKIAPSPVPPLLARRLLPLAAPLAPCNRPSGNQKMSYHADQLLCNCRDTRQSCRPPHGAAPPPGPCSLRFFPRIPSLSQTDSGRSQKKFRLWQNAGRHCAPSLSCRPPLPHHVTVFPPPFDVRARPSLRRRPPIPSGTVSPEISRAVPGIDKGEAGRIRILKSGPTGGRQS